MSLFDEVTDKTKLASFYGPQYISEIQDIFDIFENIAMQYFLTLQIQYYDDDNN